METNKLLTFEISPDGEELEIHTNSLGLEALITYLNELKNDDQSDHNHLMTPSWAGNELSEDKQNPEYNLIHKVTLKSWAD